MAKGYDINKKRQEELAGLGKTLTRRSGSRCELCDASGVPLYILEVPPSSVEPEAQWAIFVCSVCMEQIIDFKKMEAEHWRSLGEKIWSDVFPVKIMSHRILRKLACDHHWVSDILENAYLDDEEENTVSSFPL